jgi:hypothetical protein
MDVEQLTQLGACEEAIAYVKSKPSWRDVVDDCDRIDWLEWLLRRVGGLALAEYEKVCGPAGAELEKVRGPALAELEKVRGPARAELEKVRGPASAELEKVCLECAKRIALEL